MSLEQLIQDIADRAVRSTIAQLEEAGWTPPGPSEEELEEARRHFTKIANRVGNPPKTESPEAWNERLNRLQVGQLLAWLKGESGPPSNVLELTQLKDWDDRVALHYCLFRHSGLRTWQR